MLKKKKVLVTLILFLIVLSGIVSLPVIYSISARLSTTHRVKANLLLVEGWLPPYAIELAFKEFKEDSYDHVITTGIRISGYFQVSMNGYLIFYTADLLKGTDNTDVHSIYIDAYSEMGKKDCAHFNVFVNDSLVADFFADKKKRQFEINWKDKSAGIDSVMIQFDNDRFDENGDRNLYVKEIVFDKEVHIPYQYYSVYDVGLLDDKRRFDNNFNSHAELAKNALLSLGIDSSIIQAVPGKKVRINRTLSSAVAFRDWLRTSDIEVNGINIITSGTHARRTWMTYNKILKNNYEIGIISLPDLKENSSRRYKVLKTLREAFGLVYYWFILFPY